MQANHKTKVTEYYLYVIPGRKNMPKINIKTPPWNFREKVDVSCADVKVERLQSRKPAIVKSETLPPHTIPLPLQSLSENNVLKKKVEVISKGGSDCNDVSISKIIFPYQMFSLVD